MDDEHPVLMPNSAQPSADDLTRLVFRLRDPSLPGGTWPILLECTAERPTALTITAICFFSCAHVAASDTSLGAAQTGNKFLVLGLVIG